MQSLTVINVGR